VSFWLTDVATINIIQLMKTFKTKSGTELPLLDLRGKDYLQVAHRLVWFREEHPAWTIKTDVAVDFQNQRCLATAWIIDEKGTTLSMGHKVEDAKGFADYVEKAETGAIGRALAMIGYGTQFAPDLDEGDRLADAPVAPKHNFTQHVQPLNNPAGAIGAAIAMSANSAGAAVCTVGRNKGMRVDQLSMSDLLNDISYWRQREKTDGKPLSAGLATYINAAEVYTRANGSQAMTPTVTPKQQSTQPVLQNADTPPSWVLEGPSTEDIPF
jgi:hypothetical protein